MKKLKGLKQVSQAVIISVSVVALASCGGGENEEKQAIDTARSAVVKNNAQKVFYTVPSPIEMASLLQKAGAKYDRTILNDINNTSKYSSNAAKAINLGVFGADLTYASVCDQTQETMFYLKAAKILADGLGVSEAFKKETIERMENNLNHKDSMMNIISESFSETDAYLQENDRANVSALVIAGGWLEGLHIACKVAKVAPNAEPVKNRIIEQKLSLDNLLGLLSAYPEDPAISDLSKQLTSLKEVYNSINIPAAGGETNINTNSDGSVTIGGDTPPPAYTPEQLEAVSKKVEEIRNKLIN
ncbi:MAG: hypothetical protein IT239_07205 [Bacteroidia bacterium]|nr:hypothetical protein [Bacteroidia bacterium]